MKMRLLFITCIGFIFVLPIFGQSEIQDYLDYSRRLEFNGSFQRALEEINKAIDIEPSNAQLYLHRAHLYGRLGDKNAALENVNLAISLKPEDFAFLENCVQELNSSGNFDESLKIAEKLISSNKKDDAFYGYTIRYRTRFLLKDYAGTIQDIFKINAFGAAYDEGSELYSDGEGGSVLSDGLLLQTFDGLENDPNVFGYYEEIFKFIEKGKDGPTTLGSSMMRYSMQINLYARYATAYEKQHTAAENAALFDKYAKDLSLQMRAEIYKKLKRYKLAAADLTEILRKSTGDKSHYLIGRGDLYMLMKEFAKAVADYESARKIYRAKYPDSMEWVDKKLAIAKQKLDEKEQLK